MKLNNSIQIQDVYKSILSMKDTVLIIRYEKIIEYYITIFWLTQIGKLRPHGNWENRFNEEF